MNSCVDKCYGSRESWEWIEVGDVSEVEKGRFSELSDAMVKRKVAVKMIPRLQM